MPASPAGPPVPSRPFPTPLRLALPLFAATSLAALIPHHHTRAADPSPSTSTPEWAGPFDGSYQPAPEDLSLDPDGIDRASALRHFFEALRHQAAGDSSKAIAAYQKTLALAPANPRIARRAAESIAAAGAGIAGGKNLLESALEASPDDPDAKLHLSAFLATHGEPEDRTRALTLAKETVRDFPAHPEALEHYVGLSTALGQRSTAASLIESLAVEKKDRPARFWLALARSAILIWPEKKGDASPLTPGAKIVRARTDGFFARALAADPSDPLTAKEAADFFEFTGRLPNAAIVYERLLQERSDLLPERARLADLYRKLGRTDEAAIHLEALAAIDPRQPAIRHQLADLYESQKLFEKAIPHAELALKLRGGSLEDHLRLGRLLAAAGQLGPSLAHAKRSFELFPNSPHAATLLGRALYASSDFPNAAAILGKALILHQAYHPAGLDSEFYLLHGNALAKSGDLVTAERTLIKALDALPKGSPISQTTPILTALAQAQFQAGKRDEAIKSLRRAHFAAPDDAAISLLLQSWEKATPIPADHP